MIPAKQIVRDGLRIDILPLAHGFTFALYVKPDVSVQSKERFYSAASALRYIDTHIIDLHQRKYAYFKMGK